MKKIFAVAVAVCVLAACLAACTTGQKTYEGKDAYGRNFGEIYEVDSAATGTFELPYAIADTSAIGKTMIAANCADYVIVEKTESGYRLGFLCKGDMLGSVRMTVGDGVYADAEKSEKDGYNAFTFDVAREALDAKISLQCEVTVMHKTVSFSIAPDMTKAKLAG